MRQFRWGSQSTAQSAVALAATRTRPTSPVCHNCIAWPAFPVPVVLRRRLRLPGTIRPGRISAWCTEGVCGTCVHPRPYKVTTVQDRANARGLVDLVGRDFVPAAKNELWYGDVTYIYTMAGWAYLATVIDGFSRKVVGCLQEMDCRGMPESVMADLPAGPGVIEAGGVPPDDLVDAVAGQRPATAGEHGVAGVGVRAGQGGEQVGGLPP